MLFVRERQHETDAETADTKTQQYWKIKVCRINLDKHSLMLEIYSLGGELAETLRRWLVETWYL